MIATLLTIGAAVSFVAMVYGLLFFFGGSMSDNPYAGETDAIKGLIIGGVGFLCFIACIGVALYRWLS